MADHLKQTTDSLQIGHLHYNYYSLKQAQKWGQVDRLPKSLKILLENLLRFEDGHTVTLEDIKALASWTDHKTIKHSIAYHPTRVLMQDFTGVPAIVDLAAMRDALAEKSQADPEKINPLIPVDLVIDHSVSVDQFASSKAFDFNVQKEFERNKERYEFLKWGQQSFKNFRVVPPGTGICHQVNLEYLAQVVWTNKQNQTIYPDTLVGTDSHTTMINGLSVLGWGVGGIEAEAALLGQPITILIPQVVGVCLRGTLKEGSTATDLVLYITEQLRKLGVVGKFVEFYGPGLQHLSLADRATIANMAPEYGATCGFFPIDQETLNYLKLTGRSSEQIQLVKTYAQAQGLWWNIEGDSDPEFTETLDLDISDVKSSIAGPFRPQDRIELEHAADQFEVEFKKQTLKSRPSKTQDKKSEVSDGDIVIAAITSCTNTSNPSVMIAAGLMAQKANRLGLKMKPHCKTSLAPGSQVVTEYLEKSGLQKELNACGFHLVGYGCTTCIGNSGPLPSSISQAIKDNHLIVCSVLSGNRNFEGRVNPQTKFNYLASPCLVVAYALAGSMKVNLYKDPLGQSLSGQPVYLKDIWPCQQEVQSILEQFLTPQMFKEKYQDVFKGSKAWQEFHVSDQICYEWQNQSTYIKKPPFFEDTQKPGQGSSNIEKARILAILGDHLTTDHISPAGAIPLNSPAAEYLKACGVEEWQFNSFGARRGNHEVMMRGTFGNIRLRNMMVPGIEGGFTKCYASLQPHESINIFDAAMEYQKMHIPLVIFAGQNYGMGSSRDWAAKGTKLLGVKAVIAKSFERIHRSNLIGMGVLPLQLKEDVSLTGEEKVTIQLDDLRPSQEVIVCLEGAGGRVWNVSTICRIDSQTEMDYYKSGSILHFVLHSF